ncbi:hypothetical protein VC83_02846 [Pseudogymnoascus destructans]|uniref:Enoyl reductase (ER) domain-containing protein n=2 Tax=Pseudogymnoascus destructans TaxID=655981 RepID=L8FZ14_PSED2|nr:uncharacterized protein VC83_02846 [Pseudogymnoascus destructans]ELR04961.1 hypothetical protein GMDG_00218 [Pseudogymnoascus destructans 20631-21]OAF59871.1 hypothetical protein VC83_02846 [Pseudogymnoascus destructans]
MATLLLPSSMRALFQLDPNTQHLTLQTCPLPVPDLSANEHLIRAHAVAPCAGEILWPENAKNPDTKRKEPIPCYDVAGTVVTAPAGSPFQPGTEVYARTEFARTGMAREYTIITTAELGVRARNLGWAESAAVALSALTAWQALFVRGRLKAEKGAAKGKRVLVTAASGGAGSWIVQLARWAGAEVAGTCGPDNVAFVESLGVDVAINYRQVSLKDWVSEVAGRKFDLVVGRRWRRLGGLKEWRTLVSIYEPPEEKRPKDLEVEGVNNLFFIVEANGSQLKNITELVEAGVCKPVVDSVWPLEKFEDAFARLDGGHARGKVVIVVEVDK